MALTILLLSGTTVVEAMPPLPSSFHGTVKRDGTNVAEGTVVSAWINGVKYAETQSQMYQGNSVYAINVPGDDPDTTQVEGGVEGNTIVFKVGDSTASPTGTWHTGTDVDLNLTAPPTAVTLSSFTAKPVAVPPVGFTSRFLLALAVTGLIALLAASAILVKDAK
jgi:hypothetical protein